MAIFQFFLPPGKLIDFFFLVFTKKKLLYLTTTFENFIKINKKIYSITFCDAFVKLESENLHNLINKKLVVVIFVTNRFCRYYFFIA